MTCLTGKIPHPTKAAARKALTAAQRRRTREQRREERVYRCLTCNQWHLTSRTQPRP